MIQNFLLITQQKVKFHRQNCTFSTPTTSTTRVLRSYRYLTGTCTYYVRYISIFLAKDLLNFHRYCTLGLQFFVCIMISFISIYIFSTDPDRDIYLSPTNKFSELITQKEAFLGPFFRFFFISNFPPFYFFL